ncbi:MAG: DUF1919 domain-containing protein [Clostridia bacterium]|nr:DUF1919 domain-containing protein [Clostridia bacterium]
MSIINSFFRKYYNLYNRKRLHHTDITLISSNCNGGCILSDLHLRFNSPFVNLWLPPKDFLKFCENMEHYLNCDLKFIPENVGGGNYPVGILDDIKIYFQHYATAEEAANLWGKRKQRIDKNHIYILFSDRDGCTYEDLLKFDQLKYPHKIVFCSKKYKEIKSAYYIPGFEGQDCVGICSAYKNRFTYKKYYDAFDYVSWFNAAGSPKHIPRHLD